MALTTGENASVTVGEGRTSIPVRNLWLLYLWASDLYDHLDDEKAVAAEEDPDRLVELAATILVTEVEWHLHQALTWQYADRHEVLSAVRGRIDHLATLRGGHLPQGQVVCRFQDLTTDTPRHRYVLAALKHAAADLPLVDELRARTLTAATTLERLGVTGGRPDLRYPRTERFGRDDQQDRGMVAAAQFVIDALLPSSTPGPHAIRALDYTEPALRRLFESAVRNFYRRHVSSSAGSRVMHWQVPGDAASWFPTMRTDITIPRPTQPTIVVETKFTNATVPSRFDHREHRLIRDHLFQLYAYLQAAQPGSQAHKPMGVLLYPRTEESPEVHVTTTLQSHVVRVWTVDLAASSQSIRQSLLAAVDLSRA